MVIPVEGGARAPPNCLAVFTAYEDVCGPDITETQKPNALILRAENGPEAKTMPAAHAFLSV